jgi:hypothetical protein
MLSIKSKKEYFVTPSSLDASTFSTNGVKHGSCPYNPQRVNKGTKAENILIMGTLLLEEVTDRNEGRIARGF